MPCPATCVPLALRVLRMLIVVAASAYDGVARESGLRLSEKQQALSKCVDTYVVHRNFFQGVTFQTPLSTRDSISTRGDTGQAEFK